MPNHTSENGLPKTQPGIVGNGNLVGLACGLVRSADVQNAIGIDVVRDLDLGHATRSWRDAVQVELAKEVVVLGHGALTLEHLDQHSRLVVRVGGEGLSLLSWDGGVALDEFGHYTASGLQTHGQGRHVQQQQVLHLRGALSGQDGSLHRGTVGHGLVRVDGPVRLLAVEELLDHGLHLRDSGGATHQHHIVHALLVNARVLQALLHWTHGVAEVVHAQLLETRTRQGAGVIDTLEQGVDLNGGLRGRGERSLGTLALGSQASDSALVASHVLAAVLSPHMHNSMDRRTMMPLTEKKDPLPYWLNTENATITSRSISIFMTCVESYNNENTNHTLTERRDSRFKISGPFTQKGPTTLHMGIVPSGSL